MNLPYRLIDASHIEIAGKRHRFYVIHDRNTSTVWLDGRTYRIDRVGSGARRASAKGDAYPSSGEIRALMPGKLLRLTVAVGDQVSEKQTLGAMESMKMETALVAPIAGRVSEIRFKAGDVVDMGQLIIVIT